MACVHLQVRAVRQEPHSNTFKMYPALPLFLPSLSPSSLHSSFLFFPSFPPSFPLCLLSWNNQWIRHDWKNGVQAFTLSSCVKSVMSQRTRRVRRKEGRKEGCFFIVLGCDPGVHLAVRRETEPISEDKSQMAPYSLYSAPLLIRSPWALDTSSALYEGNRVPFWDVNMVTHTAGPLLPPPSPHPPRLIKPNIKKQGEKNSRLREKWIKEKEVCPSSRSPGPPSRTLEGVHIFFLH